MMLAAFDFPPTLCAGSLSDDNGKMDPHNLAVWTSIGGNSKVYMPPVEKIAARYMEMYIEATPPKLPLTPHHTQIVAMLIFSQF